MWDQYFHIYHSTSLWPIVNSVFDRWDQTKPLWCFDLYTLSLIWSGGWNDLRARHKDDTHSKHRKDQRSKLFHSEERAWRRITAVCAWQPFRAVSFRDKRKLSPEGTTSTKKLNHGPMPCRSSWLERSLLRGEWASLTVSQRGIPRRGGACTLDGRSLPIVTDSISFCLLLGPHQVRFWKHAGSCLWKQVGLILFIHNCFIIFILFKHVVHFINVNAFIW